MLGALDPSNGDRWWKSGLHADESLPHIYAPGSNILVAEGNKTKWINNRGVYKSPAGTSYGKKKLNASN